MAAARIRDSNHVQTGIFPHGNQGYLQHKLARPSKNYCQLNEINRQDNSPLQSGTTFFSKGSDIAQHEAWPHAKRYRARGWWGGRARNQDSIPVSQKAAESWPV